MRIPEQLQRLSLLIAALAVAVLLLRFVALPAWLVSTEMQRAAAVERELAKPVKFAGSDACGACHDELRATKEKGYHRNLACEGCHGPAAAHAEDPGTGKPAVPTGRALCTGCHVYDPSRPTGFPQINPAVHNPLKSCASCHNPHDPVPPQTPKACGACHAQIERMKAVSSHARLECKTCHAVPAQHFRQPRSAAPSKPAAREVCGRCHGRGSRNSQDAPKVDLGSHGGRFTCWQCHYPHMPEGRG
ncbi:MAG: hypothetical protein ACE147_07710 [Candidatus Methylomirabilales bacterium]